MDLRSKHVVITGAGGALGSAVAHRATELGAELTLIDISPPASVDAARWITVDLADERALAAALTDIEPVDCLFHIAGGFDMGPAVHETSATLFASLFATNVTTLLNIARAVIPGMVARGAGAVVTVGANSALHGLARMGAYCCAKSAVMRLTESMAAELRDSGINVNCVLPSLIDTPANRQAMPEADFGRWVSAADLANVICFLGSQSARSLHGALVPVVGRV